MYIYTYAYIKTSNIQDPRKNFVDTYVLDKEERSLLLPGYTIQILHTFLLTCQLSTFDRINPENVHN